MDAGDSGLSTRLYASGSRSRRAWVYRLILGTILAALFVLLAGGEVAYQQSEERGLQSSFVGRVNSASQFLSAYIASELHHEQVLSAIP
jgi:hypothetical protein